MALGRQLSPVNTLVTFCLWAKRAGFKVGEMHGLSTVHPVHAVNSWHYDKDDGGYGKAADINHPSGGAAERTELANAARVAQSLGLGVIFGQHGTNGPARTHQGHLHVDVGPYSNLGAGQVPTHGGGDKITAGVQRVTGAVVDEVWGQDTDTRVEAVRLASKRHGVTFPWGVEHTQRVLGATPDGVWGPRSRARHDVTVKALQAVLGVEADGIWGQQTETAYGVAREIRHRR